MNIVSYQIFGYEGSLVNVETDLRSGSSAFDILGISESCCHAVRDDVKLTFENQQIEFPKGKVLTSLSPCDLKKDGGAHSLAIALSIYAENKLKDFNETVFAMGSLDNGELIDVRGVYVGLNEALRHGITLAIIPETAEIAPSTIRVARVKDFSSAVEVLENLKNGDTSDFKNEVAEEKILSISNSLDDIKGYNFQKYALAVSAAGGHHLLLTGKDDEKSRLVKRMKNLLPKLTSSEHKEVKRIYSIYGMSAPQSRARPFVSPHYISSIEAMCGGGFECRPGYISLADKGVLLLDDCSEFRSSVLQILRIPIETKNITLSRAGRSTTYPADFTLVMTAKPCPCGNFGSDLHEKACLCSVNSVLSYWKKISLPLLERMAIKIDMKETEFPEQSEAELIAKVSRVRNKNKTLNNDLSDVEVANIPVSKNAEEYYIKTRDEKGFNSRKALHLKKVAKTISEMEKHSMIELSDMELAVKMITGMDYLFYKM